MGENRPGGKISDIPIEHRGAHPRRTQRESVQTVEPPARSFGLEQLGMSAEETIEDPSLIDIPPGASLSTGPITQPGILRTGAPPNSAFRFDQTEPEVDGKLISRHGKLWMRDDRGNLTEPTEEILKMYGWANTRKTHRLLPAYFRGADSAKKLPNFRVEEWVIE